MADSIFPSEGLDLLLEMQPRNTQAKIDPTFLGLFRAATATTVPAFATILANATDPGEAVEEVPNAGAYARVQVDGASAVQEWGAIGNGGVSDSRRTTASQQSFPESTAAWGTVNGYFLATVSTWGAGKAFHYANFSDDQPVVINAAGYTLRLTPYWEARSV
jgi:hypothetical protein